MIAKGTLLGPTAPQPEWGKLTALSEVLPRTLEERVQRIEALGERIAGYVRFMCERGTPSGTSAEAKERALTTFYERLIIVERQLGKIQEELLLA
jgi:hypothetical protein